MGEYMQRECKYFEIFVLRPPKVDMDIILYMYVYASIYRDLVAKAINAQIK